MSKPIQPAIPRKRKRRNKAKSPYKTPTVNTGPLSSLNLANILGHFLTIRSVIKDLSTSLKRLENILDSLYQMFEIAQTLMAQKQRTPGRPPPSPDPSTQHQKIPLRVEEDESHSGDDSSNRRHPFRETSISIRSWPFCSPRWCKTCCRNGCGNCRQAMTCNKNRGNAPDALPLYLIHYPILAVTDPHPELLKPSIG